MEAERGRRTRARNPLSDCTNTAKSSQSSSASAPTLPHLRKSRKLILSSAINKLVNNPDRKSAVSASGSDRAGIDAVPVVATPTRLLSRPASASGKENGEGVELCSVFREKESAENLKSVLKPTENLSGLVVTSGKRKGKENSGKENDEEIEPCSVYRRRESAEKRKSALKPSENLLGVVVTSDKRKGKEKVVDEPLTCPPATKIRKIGVSLKDDGANIRPKACTALPKKKKSGRYSDKLSQDYIEQQRAYFAEIDAFELSEEEVDALSD